MSDARADYERWHEGLGVDIEAATPWHQLVRRNLDSSRDLFSRRLLETGCGRGGFAIWLGARAGTATIVASDFSRTAVAMGRECARTRAVTSVLWSVADAARLPHPDAAFDTVVSCETIEHVPDPPAVVAEFARVLRRGGRLYLTSPNYLGPMGLYRAWRRLTARPYTEEGQPINHFTTVLRTRRWVTAAGLRILRTDGVGHYLPIPGRAPLRVKALDRPWMVWMAHHSFILAEKP